MAFSFKMTQQPGRIKRVMCCTEAELARYDDKLLNLMPTHVAPSYEYYHKGNCDCQQLLSILEGLQHKHMCCAACR